MTVLEAIQKCTDFLAKKGVESPRLQTELLLAHRLQMPRMKLYLNFERVLSEAEADALRELVKRRSLHEPLQHITGSTSFCGHEIKVNREVLVPRPETAAGGARLAVSRGAAVTGHGPGLRDRERLRGHRPGGPMFGRGDHRPGGVRSGVGGGPD